MVSRKKLIAVIASLFLLAGIGTALYIFSNFNSNGYYWKCLDEDHYVSHIHKLSNTAVTKANAHAAKYGHRVTVYEHD